MRRSFIIPSLLLLVLFVSQCILVEPEAERPAARALTTAEQHVTDADNRFGLKLFRTLSAEKPDENVFISPLSISMALGMTLNGTRGDTYAAIQETLELSGLSVEEINASYQSLIDLLSGLDPQVVFKIANSIWYRQGFAVEPAFLQTNRDHFNAEVRDLDFGDPASVDVINGWVDDKTHGKIPEIIDDIDPSIVMFLINAIYFKGAWTYEFDEAYTQEAAFTGRDSATSTVPMMHQTADLPYFETDTFQAVDLPYGDSLFSMTVLLPREGESLDALIEGLDEAQWNDWTGRFTTQLVNLGLPRFKLEYEKTLNEVLMDLGMGIAFTCGRADFTGLSPAGKGLCISYVKHKTFVEVNEEGTEAAAATVVAIQESAGGPSYVWMLVNRPFAFVLRERHSGTILFIGKVNRL